MTSALLCHQGLIRPIMGFPVNGITHFALLCLWLLDPTQSCRDSSCITDSFFLVTKRYALWEVPACSTIRLPVDSQSISSFGWPRKDSVIICVQVFWGTYALISLGSVFRSRKLGQKNANILSQDFMVCVMTWTLQMSFFIA